jgi:hypothetical protein
VKIEIELSPPAREGSLQTESLWAKPVGEDLFEVASVPFLEYNLNLGDTVRCNVEVHPPRVLQVVRRSGQETLRLIFFESATGNDIRGAVQYLRGVGAVIEPMAAGRAFSTSLPSWKTLVDSLEHLKAVLPAHAFTYESGFRKV